MNESQVYDRLTYILNKDEIKRVEINRVNAENHKSIKNQIQIMLNVHGWSVKKTEVVIDKLVKLMIGSFELCVIHGYIHGTHIKDMLTRYTNTRLVDTNSKYCLAYNPGVTYMDFKSM